MRFIVLVTLVCFVKLSAQKSCKDNLITIVSNYSNGKTLNSSQMLVFDLFYTIKPIAKTTTTQKTAVVKATITPNMSILTTDDNSVYLDSTQSFRIVKGLNEINWSKNPQNNSSNQMIVNTELFKLIDTYTCSNVTIKAKNYKKVDCKPLIQVTQEQGIKNVEYILDGSKIYRARVYYTEITGIDYMEMLYTQTRILPLDERYKKGLRIFFLIPNTEKLVPRFAKYKLQKI